MERRRKRVVGFTCKLAKVIDRAKDDALVLTDGNCSCCLSHTRSFELSLLRLSSLFSKQQIENKRSLCLSLVDGLAISLQTYHGCLSPLQSCPPAPPSLEAPAHPRPSCLSLLSRRPLNRRAPLRLCCDRRVHLPLPVLPRQGTASEVVIQLTTWPRCLNSPMQFNLYLPPACPPATPLLLTPPKLWLTTKMENNNLLDVCRRLD